MGERPLNETSSLDESLKEAIEERLGRPPDDYVESSEGGAVSAERLAAYSETEEMETIGLLDIALSDINSEVVDKDGNLIWD